MIEKSLARGSRPRTAPEEVGGFEHVGEIVPRAVPVVEAIEREIARLKTARPRLSTRVERAEYIIVTQLATANGAVKPIKVRVHADGSRSYAVRSGSRLRKLYTVRGSGFTCDCPDARRRRAGQSPSACKHGIACWLLERALRRPSSKPPTCEGCGAGDRELFEVADSLTFFEGDLICAKCRDNTASDWLVGGHYEDRAAMGDDRGRPRRDGVRAVRRGLPAGAGNPPH